MRLCVVRAVTLSFVLLRMFQLYSCFMPVVLLCSFSDPVFFSCNLFLLCVPTVRFSVCNLNLFHCNLNLCFVVFVVCRPEAREIMYVYVACMNH